MPSKLQQNACQFSQQQLGDFSYIHMSANLSYLDRLLQQLLKSKQSSYSEQCINFYLDQQRFAVEDLTNLRNEWGETLKCTLVKHRQNKNNRNRQTAINSKCIIYLHGLGSSRLEALSIVQNLPLSYCLCMFDMSGSGKSDGEFITYGIKESEDIDPVIRFLHNKKYIRQFIVWGRSMGAVATLTYALEKRTRPLNQTRQRSFMSSNNSLRNSLVSTANRASDKPMVKAIVLDSPFHNFKDIAKEIAINRLNIPSIIADVALSYVQSSFQRILTQRIGDKYNPFRIDFNSDINLDIPIIFLYSEHDEIVPAHHSQKIIKCIKSKFQKILINQCKHNQSRPTKILLQIFQKIDKFQRNNYYQNKKMHESISKDMTISYSCQKKRGIFVYTPSKEKDYKTIDFDQERRFSTISITHEQKSPKKQQSIKKSRLSLQSPKGKRLINFSRPKLQQIRLQNMATIDTQTNNLISKKLEGIKDSDSTATRKLRSRRFNFQRKKQVRLTHHKYLQ